MPNLKDCKVLVTPTSYGKFDPALRTLLEAKGGEVVYNTTGRPLTSNQLMELIPGCDGFIAGVDTIDRAVIEVADRLRVISRYGVGVDNVDLPSARENGIVVTNTPGANSKSVAELTVGLILSLARSIPSANNATKANQWPRMGGITLAGKVVGLIGFGAIGKEVAHRLAGFDCTILAHDPHPDRDYAKTIKVELLPLKDVIRQADFLSLHLPLLPETRNMVNTEFLKQMKTGAFLVNTSRGGIVDEAALIEALNNGQLRGAALDVFSNHPPEDDNPLLILPQVIATPHMASNTDGAANAMGWSALNDCLAVLRGEDPLHPVHFDS